VCCGRLVEISRISFLSNSADTHIGDPAAVEVTTRPISLTTPLPNASLLWRHWLQDCLTNHKLCKGHAPSFMPKRLIKLWRHCGEISLRLIDTENSQPDSYATLSYCWGGPQPTQTTLANVKAYQVSLDWKIMPKTIQDAIITTLELNLGYLWVDSLCIIQDSEQDKEQEMAKMPDIYRQAIVTIAASVAGKVVEGFLQHDRLYNRDQIFRLPYICRNGEVGCVSLLPTNYDDLWNEGPLQFRAWALQERAMSSRVLSFNRQSTRWLCPTSDSLSDGWMNASEGHNGSLILLAELPFQELSVEKFNLREKAKNRIDETLLHTNETSLTRSNAPSSPKALEPRRIHSPLAVLDIWLKLIREYSGRTLSFSSDKFRAISAIAQEFGKILDRPYLAGLWMIDPYVELLWEWDGYGPWEWDYVAPSWSWAAVSKVRFYNTGWSHTLTAEVIDVKVEWRNKLLQFGQAGHVERGELSIKGHLLTVWWSAAQHEELWFDSERQKYLGRFLPDGQLNARVETESHSGSESESESGPGAESEPGPASRNVSARKPKLLPQTRMGVPSTRLTASLSSKLPVFVLLLGVDNFGHTMSAKGLVLKRRDAKTFSRVGIFSMDSYRLSLPKGEERENVEEKLEEFMKNPEEIVVIV